MVEWHHQLSGQELEQTLGDSEGWGSLAYCCLWGVKESVGHNLLTEETNRHCNFKANFWFHA